MRFLPYFLASAAFFSLSLSAHADSFATLVASGVFQSGATLSGTLTIDSTTGVFTAGDLFVSSPDSLEFNATAQSCDYPVAGVCTVQVGTGTAYSAPSLDLDIVAINLIGYAGGSLGSLTAPDQGYTSDINGAGHNDALQSGSLTLAATPEPSSLILLGTGFLGVAGAARRRFRNR